MKYSHLNTIFNAIQDIELESLSPTISFAIKNVPRLLFIAPVYQQAMIMNENKSLSPALEGNFVKSGKSKQVTNSNLKTNSTQWSK